MARRTYKSGTLKGIYEMSNELEKASVIDKQTMRQLNESCSTPPPL